MVNQHGYWFDIFKEETVGHKVINFFREVTLVSIFSCFIALFNSPEIIFSAPYLVPILFIVFGAFELINAIAVFREIFSHPPKSIRDYIFLTIKLLASLLAVSACTLFALATFAYVALSPFLVPILFTSAFAFATLFSIKGIFDTWKNRKSEKFAATLAFLNISCHLASLIAITCLFLLPAILSAFPVSSSLMILILVIASVARVVPMIMIFRAPLSPQQKLSQTGGKSSEENLQSVQSLQLPQNQQSLQQQQSLEPKASATPAAVVSLPATPVSPSSPKEQQEQQQPQSPPQEQQRTQQQAGQQPPSVLKEEQLPLPKPPQQEQKQPTQGQLSPQPLPPQRALLSSVSFLGGYGFQRLRQQQLLEQKQPQQLQTPAQSQSEQQLQQQPQSPRQQQQQSMSVSPLPLSAPSVLASPMANASPSSLSSVLAATTGLHKLAQMVKTVATQNQSMHPKREQQQPQQQGSRLQQDKALQGQRELAAATVTPRSSDKCSDWSTFSGNKQNVKGNSNTSPQQQIKTPRREAEKQKVKIPTRKFFGEGQDSLPSAPATDLAKGSGEVDHRSFTVVR